MTDHLTSWYFTENGNAYNLGKITCINRYETKVLTPKTDYVVVMDNKENLLVSAEEATELIKALKDKANAEREWINKSIKETERY